jgi:hypothetical protein
MKKHNIFLTALLSLISITGFSQDKQFVYYFDKDFNPTEKSKSVYNGIGMVNNDLFEFRMYDALTNKLLLIAHYTDSSLQEYEGLFQSFYSNTLKQSGGNYLKGKKNGLWRKWDSTGNIIDSSVYENNLKVTGTAFTYHQNRNKKSLITDDVKENKLYRTFYDENGNVTARDTLKEAERADIVFTKSEIEASFAGGVPAWTQYITEKLNQNIKALKHDRNSVGICRIKFIVDKKGNVTNVQALNMKDSKLAKVAIEAIVNGPKWVPAMQNGRYVNAFKDVLVTFPIEN